MKTIFLSFFVLFNYSSFAQNLELTGNIEQYGKPKGKIYYAISGQKFNAKTFINYDSNKYHFKISLNKIKNENIQSVFFSEDTSSSITNEFSCKQEVKIGSIVTNPLFENKKSIILRNDLVLNFHCSMSSGYGASEDEVEKFTGEYRMIIGDSVFAVTLGEMFYRYRSTCSKLTPDYTDKQFGRWEYNDKEKTLTFYVFYQMNEKLGIMIDKGYSYKFNVLDNAGKLLFSGYNMILEKIK